MSTVEAKLRVCIADDHLLMLHGIRDALTAAADIDVVGIARDGDQVLALVDAQRPDVVLLDHRMPGIDGIHCLLEIRRRWPQVRVVMLSASEDPRQIAEALAAGASAYIGKRINPEDLASALRQVVAGVVHLRSPDGVEEAAAPDDPGLTAREQVILEQIAGGFSTKVISRELSISERTVKFHLTNIYRKLGAHNRTGAMRHAYEHGLIATPGADALSA
jgi:DNA-binding NarL/FixJ family response regulator